MAMAVSADNTIRAGDAAALAAETVEKLRRDTSRPKLSPLARAVAAEPLTQAMSPIIITGVVRLYEFCVITMLGIALYSWHVDPRASTTQYVIASFAVALAAVIAFESLNLYSISAFRARTSQIARLALAWT